jgi:cyclic pyranopterin phosphate synthase
MPEEGVPYIPHQQILRFEEIVDFIHVAVNYGINKVRITGGEPLVRKGIVQLVSMIHEIKEIEDLSMTTNGFYLEEFAEPLVKAGLKRINISLDAINPEHFAAITRGGNVSKVIKGIYAAQKAGLNPIKLNVVIKSTRNEPDAKEVEAFAAKNNLQVRFIHLMTLSSGIFSKVEGGDGGHCSTCNRLRLTADGFLMPCLFSDIKINIREMNYEKAILKAVELKPKSGSQNKTGTFYNIGG